MHLPIHHSAEIERCNNKFRCGVKWNWAAMAACAAFIISLTIPVLAGSLAQNQKKSKDNNKDADVGGASLVPVPDTQAIDTAVGQMLGAWQVGDIELMHKYYSDDVVVVSGNWEPPLIGWDAYLRAYQAQRARSQNGRMDRSNTLTKVMGDSAWVTYQWEYVGQVDGSQLDAVGHTTLVLQKRAGNWVIVVNHTSTAPLPVRSSAVPAAAPSAKP
jgi:ketosteroid isomerase-like protein